MLKYLKNLSVYSLSLLVCFIIFEIFLRFSEISLPSMVLEDPRVGRDFKPNSNVMILREGFYMGQINQGGYLGNYYPKSRTENSLRIALCGDSFVEGFHIFPQHHFGSVLRDNLQKQTSNKIEVLNFGRSGQDLQTMFIYFSEKVVKYSPDIVLFFISSSDLLSSDINLGPKLIIHNNKLDIDYSFNCTKKYINKKKLSFLRNASSYSLIINAVSIYSGGKAADIILDKFSNSRTSAKNKLPIKSKSEMIIQNDPINEMIFFNLKYMCEKRLKAIFIQTDEIPKNYKESIIKNNIRIINLKENVLDKLRDKGIDPSYWKATKKKGHWNPEAHKVIGEYLASILTEYCND